MIDGVATVDTSVSYQTVPGGGWQEGSNSGSHTSFRDVKWAIAAVDTCMLSSDKQQLTITLNSGLICHFWETDRLILFTCIICTCYDRDNYGQNCAFYTRDFTVNQATGVLYVITATNNNVSQRCLRSPSSDPTVRYCSVS